MKTEVQHILIFFAVVAIIAFFYMRVYEGFQNTSGIVLGFTMRASLASIYKMFSAVSSIPESRNTSWTYYVTDCNNKIVFTFTTGSSNNPPAPSGLVARSLRLYKIYGRSSKDSDYGTPQIPSEAFAQWTSGMNSMSTLIGGQVAILGLIVSKIPTFSAVKFTDKNPSNYVKFIKDNSYEYPSPQC
jgi:hypothetical protein